MRRYLFQLRTRVLLATLLAATPAFAFIGYTAVQQQQAAEADAREDVRLLAQRLAAPLRRRIDNARVLLQALARLPTVRDFRAPECGRFLAELSADYPQYANLGVISADGRLVCSANATGRDIDYSGSELLAQGQHGFVVGAQSGPARRIAVALPLGAESPPAVLYASLRNEAVAAQLTETPLPAGTVARVVDARGLLGSLPGPAQEDPSAIAASLRESGGTIIASAPGAEPRLYAGAPLAANSALMAYVGVPARTIFAEARSIGLRYLLGLAAVGILIVALGWLASSLLLARGIRALIAATRRLAAGDLAARSRVSHDRGEVGELARAFDHMAMTLESQRGELARQREGLERINRVHAVTSAINALIIRVRDQDSLLRSACEIACTQGRFACAWIGETRPGEYFLARTWRACTDDTPEGLLPEPGEWITDRRSAMLAALHEARVGIDNHLGKYPWTEPWQDTAGEAGYRSCIHLPLRRGERIIACMVIFSDQEGFFDAQEVKLMKDLAADLSLALDYLDKAERLKYLAYNDIVTGLPNATLFRDRLRHALLQQRRRKGRLAVLVLALDQQDTQHGVSRHLGDALLQAAGQRLRGCLRATDTVSRLHEEEFGVLLDAVGDDDDVERALAKLRECFAVPISVDGRPRPLRARIGVATYPQDGREPEALIERAAQRVEAAGAGAAPLSLRR